VQQRVIAERYHLEGHLGRGGMAEVWRAWDNRLGRPVAVKILDQLGLADPSGIERFRREAQAVARIAHPNIVAAYDYGSQDGRPYLVMELVAGDTLDALLTRGPLPIPEAVRIAAQACAALDAAHRAGVVHRDIKPGNLIITPDGTVKVLDFGIARLQDTATQAALTRPATVIGTSHYMAPEQAAGTSADPRTDLYAIGCVLYAALTGAPPFPGDNPMGVLYQHLNTPPPPLRERRPDVPPALDQLIGELLAKNPADRPADAAQVRARLLGLTGGTSVMPAPAGMAAPGGMNPTAGTGAAAGMQIGRATVSPQTGSAPGTGYLPVPPADQMPSRGGGHRWLLPVGAAVGGGLLTLFLVLLTLPDGQRTAGPPAAATSTSATPSLAPSPSPSPTRVVAGARGRLAQLRDVLAAQVAAGQVDDEAEQRITDLLDKIAEDLQKGERKKAAEHTAELRRRLINLAEDERISGDAYDELSAAATRLARALPGTGGGDRRKWDRDDGDGDD
jgi:serine/threonine-protein kinase